MSKIELGCVVRDSITGFEGVVIAISEYLNGCTTACVKAQKLKDGKPISDEWFDIEQLRLTKKAKMKRKLVSTGGPQNYPKRSNPRRRG